MVQRSPITQKALDALTPEELAVVNWQYHLNGDFYKALWEAISRADIKNLERIRAGFPTEVAGYKLFAYQDGWWPAVEKKVAEINAEELQRREEGKG